MKAQPIAFVAPQTALVAGDADLQAVPVAERLWMYQLLTLIRVFEEKLLALKAENLINGPVHTSVGQEAVAKPCRLVLNMNR